MDGAPRDARPRSRARSTSRRVFLTALAAGAGGGLGVVAAIGARSRWAATDRSPQAVPTSGADSLRPPQAAMAAPPSSRVENGTVEAELVAQEVEWELAPGRRVAALAFNGQVPGPEIRVREGQHLRVALTNRLPTPTSIHWHGVDVPIAMDGVPDMPTPAVQPGETFVYDFIARPAGARWYHTHFASIEQLDRGLYAPLFIEPATSESEPPDREYTLVLGAWVTGLSAPVPDASSGGMMGGDMGGMMSGMMGGGMMLPDRPDYDTFAVNGKAYPATTALTVGEGERIRLRLINASGMRSHLIHLEGHRLRVTHTDGNALQAPVEVDAVPLAPAERYDVQFTADRPGVWSLHDLAPGQTEAGLRVPVVYAGREGQAEAPPRTDASGLRAWSYRLGRGEDRLPDAWGSRRSYAITLSGGMGRMCGRSTANASRRPIRSPFGRATSCGCGCAT